MVQWRSLLLASEAFEGYIRSQILDGKISEEELRDFDEFHSEDFDMKNQFWL